MKAIMAILAFLVALALSACANDQPRIITQTASQVASDPTTIPPDVQSKLDDLTAKLHALQSKVEGIESIRDELNGVREGASLLSDRVTALEHLPAEIAAVQGEQGALTQRVTALEHLPAEIGAIRDEQAVLTQRVTALEHLPAEIGAIRDEQAVLTQRVTALEPLPEEIVALRSAQDALTHRVTGLEDRLAALESFVHSHNHVIAWSGLDESDFIGEARTISGAEITVTYMDCDASFEWDDHRVTAYGGLGSNLTKYYIAVYKDGQPFYSIATDVARGSLGGPNGVSLEPSASIHRQVGRRRRIWTFQSPRILL